MCNSHILKISGTTTVSAHAEWVHFFYTLSFTYRNKYFPAVRLAIILGTQWTGNTLFCKGGPSLCVCVLFERVGVTEDVTGPRPITGQRSHRTDQCD